MELVHKEIVQLGSPQSYFDLLMYIRELNEEFVEPPFNTLIRAGQSTTETLAVWPDGFLEIELQFKNPPQSIV